MSNSVAESSQLTTDITQSEIHDSTTSTFPYYEMICTYGSRGMKFSERFDMWYALKLLGGFLHGVV